MSEHASPRRRVARALTFAVLMSVTGATAHALSGGMVPAPRVLLETTAAVFAAAWWLAARRRHWLLLTTAAVAGQLGLHATYALSMQSASRARALATIMCGTPHGHPRVGMAGMPAPMPMWSAGWMTAAHCAAAVVVVLVARHGEDVASYVAHLARTVWIFDLPLQRPAPAGPAVAPHDVTRPRCAGLLWARGIRLRGPPALPA